MDWKTYLKSDLSRLFGKGRPIHERHELRGKKWRGYFYLRKMLWQRDLVVVTSQLAAIARCNAPLVEGLSYAAASAPNGRVQDVLLAVRADITRGNSLSESMDAIIRFFPRFYVDMVKAGEESGKLAENLQALIGLVQQTNATTRTIRGWAMYLTLLLVAQLSILSFLTTYVLPQFVEVFADFGTQMPEPARTVIRAYDYFAGDVVVSEKKGMEGIFGSKRSDSRGYFALLVLLAILITAASFHFQFLWTASRTGRRELFRRFIRCIPFGRHIDTKLTLSHITGIMERLLAAGMPIDRALADCADLDIGSRHRNLMLRVCERVKKGLTLSEAFKDESGLPRSFRTMVSVGETSGLLPEALGRISVTYERQALSSARVFADTVAPLVVVAAGSVTLLVTLSVHMGTVGIIETLLSEL